MALVSKNLTDLITIARASGGGRFNASGNYEWLAADTPRLDYDPATLQPRGILIEEQRTNLLLYSSQFGNAAWGKTAASITLNAATAPDGTLTAQKLVEDTSGATGGRNVLQAVSVTTGTTYTFSFYAKAAGQQFVGFAGLGLTAQGYAVVFDLVNGTIPTDTGKLARIKPIGNGWFRCSVTITASSTAAPSITLCNNSAGNSVYTGDGVSGAYLWGAQLEVGRELTSHIPTTSAQVTRAADVASVNTLSPWFNAAAGTLVREIVLNNELPTATSAPYATALINSGNVNSEIVLRLVSGTPSYADAIVRNNGTSVADTANQSLPSPVAGTVIKQAVSWDSQSVTTALNGVVGGTNPVSVALPTGLNKLNLLGASEQVASGGKSAYLKSIRYYPKRLTDAKLQELTA